MVVADTSPLNYLILVEASDILPALFGRICVPTAVVTELAHPRAPVVVKNWMRYGVPDWIEVRNAGALEAGLEYVGAGEREAIALAMEIGAAALLIDDRVGRREATERGLRVVGTLALLSEAARRNLVDLNNVLDRLLQTNFRISEELLRALRSQGG